MRAPGTLSRILSRYGGIAGRNPLGLLVATAPAWWPAPGVRAATLPAPPGPEVPVILVLYPDAPTLPANRLFDESFGPALRSDSSRTLECVSEFLDDVRFPAAYAERMCDMLRQKFASRPPEAVVAVSQTSLEFCRRYRGQLFPDAPLVFALLGGDLSRDADLGPRVTGVRPTVDVPAVLRVGLQLHPRTRHVYVVGSPEDTAGVRSRATQLRASTAQLHHLPAEPLVGLLAALGRIPDASLVIDLSKSGSPARAALPDEWPAAMARATRAPVYGCQDPGAASGLVGAVVTPVREVGAETAQLVLQVLSRAGSGELPPVRTLPAAPIFDWRGLQRWGIRSRQLPPGSLVEFKPRSVWEQYAALVITTSALFLLQSGLIVALVLQSRRRRRAERDAQGRREELAHMTRVATMGELTASLAHEINQPLAAILVNVRAAQRLLAGGAAGGPEIDEILADIAADDQRAGEVIRRMRSLLRKGESEPGVLDVNELVTDVVGLVRSEMILQNVPLALDLSNGVRTVHGDRVQLQQVLLNLVMNALDAMKETAGSARRVLVRTDCPDGRAVRVAVEDGGAGVPADKQEQIFEPFVTTKPHGMGLGLAICRSIIQAHGGKIGVTSNSSGGATFWFMLPAAEGGRP